MERTHNTINRELLEKLANYAGLKIEESEIENYLTELNGILDFLEEFAEAEIPECSEKISGSVLRKDEVKPGLNSEWLEDNAEMFKGFVCSARIWDKEQK